MRLAGCFDIRRKRSDIEMASLGFDARMTRGPSLFLRGYISDCECVEQKRTLATCV